ncbi:lysophospholipid acyltransferase family protein [Prochlorothrix hollandica]|uniref:lysophospholipid acyltransferase family protein n=1 Tax=Prochlorothrix hollandica TaxID=1223 RepID=UPI0033422E62
MINLWDMALSGLSTSGIALQTLWGPPTNQFQGYSLDDRDPAVIEALMPYWQWAYDHYFQAQSDGWHQIPDGQVLLVGSHNGGLAAPDMHLSIYQWMRHFGPDRLTYGLMHPHMWTALPHFAQLATQVGAIRATSRLALAAFQRGASVLVYPGGGQDVFRPHHQRDQIYFAGRTGFIKLALRTEVPIVPVVSWGAHDTLFVLGDFYEQAKEWHQRLGLPWFFFGIDPETFPIYVGLPWGLALGPLPNIPWCHPIRIRVGQPITFSRYGRDAACDLDYVAECCDRVRQAMQQDLTALAIAAQA